MSSSAPEPTPLRLVGTLTVAGLLCGLLIAVTYQTTLPRIQANEARALRLAVFRVLPGSQQMLGLSIAHGKLMVDPPGGPPPELYSTYDAEGKLVGYAVPAEGPGFQDTIRLLYGFDPRRQKIVGMQVLDSRETPGLGARIATDKPFLSNFKALSVRPTIILVKHARTGPNQVDAISGSTISSNAVVKILNRSCRKVLKYLTPEAAPPAPTSGSQQARPPAPGGPVGAPRAGSEVKP